MPDLGMRSSKASSTMSQSRSAWFFPAGCPHGKTPRAPMGCSVFSSRNPSVSTPIGKRSAAKLSQRPFGQYCISSDGDLPAEIGREEIERLDILTDKALDVTRRRLAGETGAGTEDNAALKFLTWQFRRCPTDVVKWLTECIETRGRAHPFVRHQMSWVLVYQGLGRILRDEEAVERVVEMLLSSDVENWVWNRQSACMAFLLSRSDMTPMLLSREDVDRLASRTLTDFRRNIGEEYTKFNYAPFCSRVFSGGASKTPWPWCLALIPWPTISWRSSRKSKLI